MGFHLFSNSGQIQYGIKNYIADFKTDLKNIPKNPGNMVFVIEESKYYITNNKQDWVEYKNNNSTEELEAEIDITENGIHDVSFAATANINVPQGVFPEGEQIITENGDYDITEKESVRVTVPQGVFPSGTKLITENVTGEDVTNFAAVDVAVPVGVFPSGTENITRNGDYDVTLKQTAHVAVPVIVPSGDIKLGQVGQHDVSNYATATVSEFVRKEGAPNLDLLMQPGRELAHESGFNVVFFSFYNYQQHDIDTTLFRLSASGLNNAKAVRINDDGTWTELKSFTGAYIQTDADWPAIGWNCIRLEYNNNVKQTFDSYFTNGFVVYEAYIRLPRLSNGDQYRFQAEHFTVIDAAPTSSESWQSLFSSRLLTHIDFHNCDTSSVTNMSSMFNSCFALQSVDLSSFDTSSVTNMSSMFNSCSALQSVDLSSFDTSSVTNMNSMFQYCHFLTVLSFGDKQFHQFPVSGTAEKTWTANNATNSASTSNMFYSTSNLKHVLSFVSLNKSLSITSNALTVESLLEIIDELETVLTTQTLTIGATNIAKLTTDQIAIAQDKGWTVI